MSSDEVCGATPQGIVINSRTGCAMQTGVISFIGVGANQACPSDRCREAIRRVGERDGIRILRRASFYRTEPVGMPGQPWCINTVLEIRTTLPPRRLMAVLLEIEQEMGRRRDADETGARARVIDLDLLLYGQEVIEEEGLIVPHPRLHERRFVLEPLNEIASYVLHPAFGVSVRGLYSRCSDRAAVERVPDVGDELSNPDERA